MKRFVREKGKVAGAAVGEMPAQWSAAMPLCACTECIRRGYVSPEEAQRMHAAAALAGRKTRGRISSAVEEVQRKVHERQCQRVYPAPKDITQQHIEEVIDPRNYRHQPTRQHRFHRRSSVPLIARGIAGDSAEWRVSQGQGSWGACE